MRDTRRTLPYFQKYLENETRKILKYKDMAEKVKRERGEEDTGLKRAYRIIQNSYFNKLNCLYSMGAPIGDIRRLYSEMIQIMNKEWNKESGYVRLVWMLSIGNMINVPHHDVNQLRELVVKSQLKDYLVDFLLNDNNNGLDRTTPSFMFSDPYSILYEVIHASSENEAIEKLKYYLESKWYPGHEDTGWYDSHKSQHDTYNGYWSYESGAIVTILKLDDTALKGTPYYPYDMVHFK